MQTQSSTNKTRCCREDILLYLDCEMSPQEELAFEEHVAHCKDCHTELNEQKKMLSALDFAFEDDGAIDPPKDFAKIVVARAESGVSGLRHPKERTTALLLCLLMLLLVGLGIGGDGILSMVTVFGQRIYSVVLMAGHLIHDISLGTAIILRSLCQQTILSSYSFGMISVLLLVVTTMAGYALRLHNLIRR